VPRVGRDIRTELHRVVEGLFASWMFAVLSSSEAFPMVLSACEHVRGSEVEAFENAAGR
jgi:hypothetical protein